MDLEKAYKLVTFMNTHSDGLYGTLSTLYKRKTLVSLESATPAVDHPVSKVELR
jgi:hypothetical protein